MLDWVVRKISGDKPFTIDHLERLTIDPFMTDISGQCPVIASGLGTPAILLRDTTAVRTYEFWIGAGLWALKFDYQKRPDGGLYAVLLDGERVGIIDGHDPTEQEVEGGCVFRVRTTGKKRMQLKMMKHPEGGEVGVVSMLDLRRID